MPVHSRISSWFRNFWKTDRGLSLFLSILLCYMFLLPVILPGTRGVVTDAFFLVLLLSGVVATSRRRWHSAVMFLVVFAALVLHVLNRFRPSDTLQTWSDAGTLSVLALFSLIVIAQVFRGGKVTGNRIKGAVAAYLLFGLVWAYAYHIVSMLMPGAFAGVYPHASEFSSAWIYYSFVTLTTVGYGDITPVAQAARSLAILEALTGQLYPAILIARLVSLELLHRTENNPEMENNG